MIKSAAQSSITKSKKFNSFAAGYVASSDFKLAESILSTNATSVTFDVSSYAIQGYKNLQLRIVSRTNRAGSDAGDAYIQFNDDSSAAYSAHQLYGDGSSVGSAGYINQSFMYAFSPLGPNQTAGAFSASIHDILDFSNTAKYKTMRSFAGGAGYAAGHHAPATLWGGSWRSLSAITSITITCAYGASFTANSRFSLYGSL
jgi:hypothetical protein